MPTPYALNSDLVSAWPAKSLEVATYLDTALAAKTDTAMTQNAQTGTSYSYALADASKLLSMSNAASNTVLVTKQATVAWVTGTQLRVINLGAGVTTLVADTGVTINNNKALAQYQGGTLIRTASDVWTFQPNAVSAASATSRVDTAQSTSSNSGFVDLATVGPSVTLTTGTKALIIFSAKGAIDTAARSYECSVGISGASTIAAASNTGAFMSTSNPNYNLTMTNAYVVTGLTAGSNVFTLKYQASSGSSGTATFKDRVLTVVDMGS